jgi:8-oxo-dGTP diphosphatase
MAEPRKHTEVAVGILLREDGAMLLSTRPPGKPYAGTGNFRAASWKRARP